MYRADPSLILNYIPLYLKKKFGFKNLSKEIILGFGYLIYFKKISAYVLDCLDYKSKLETEYSASLKLKIYSDIGQQKLETVRTEIEKMEKATVTEEENEELRFFFNQIYANHNQNDIKEFFEYNLNKFLFLQFITSDKGHKAILERFDTEEKKKNLNAALSSIFGLEISIGGVVLGEQKQQSGSDSNSFALGSIFENHIDSSDQSQIDIESDFGCFSSTDPNFEDHIDNSEASQTTLVSQNEQMAENHLFSDDFGFDLDKTHFWDMQVEPKLKSHSPNL